MHYPTAEDLIAVLAAVGVHAEVHDAGLLESALARPRVTVFGADAYPDPWQKAAALLQSLMRNRPFLDGNKRAGWNGVWTFIEVNEIGVLAAGFDVDRAEQFVVDMATGQIEDVAEIADGLKEFAVPVDQA